MPAGDHNKGRKCAITSGTLEYKFENMQTNGSAILADHINVYQSTNVYAKGIKTGGSLIAHRSFHGDPSAAAAAVFDNPFFRNPSAFFDNPSAGLFPRPTSFPPYRPRHYPRHFQDNHVDQQPGTIVCNIMLT